MPLEDIMRERRAKLDRWRELGVEPYAYRYDPTHQAADLHARGDSVTEEPGEVVRVAGRLMSQRGHGKTAFAHILDGSGQIQVYFRKDDLGEDVFERYRLLDLGDWVGVEGPLFRTKKGEITVKVTSFDMLSKSMRPPPGKWHGLKDPETRYRQRYVDLFMNADVRDVFRKRAGLITGLRAGLDTRGYLEVDTPVLQPLYGGAFARPFVTHHNALDMPLYLRISNELYLKRLIVGGLDRVYEFSRDFRNEGIDRTHSPEFTMLEYYQAFADVNDMMSLTESLICEAIEKACGTLKIEWEGKTLDFTPPWRRVSMIDAVSEKVGEDISDLDPAKLERLAKAHGVETRPGMGVGGLADELFSELVEEDMEQPTFVLEHPVETSPLARVSRDKPGVVERFELFVAGMELANAFSEQNDADAQRAAFDMQMKLREAGDDEAQMMDHDYVRALEYGMPPTGGVGIGIDRLVMLVTNQRNIREVMLFPQLRPEEGRGDVDEESQDTTVEPSPSSASS